jgi:NAD(P)-dependent dehydrogenase (short-subunit alcohol dehydrogenase family)
MKVLLIGANGTIGNAVRAELSQRHEVISAGRSSGDERVNIVDPGSIRELYKRVGKVDAVACAAGSVHFGALADMTPELFDIGLRDKLMGQVNLVVFGRDYLNDGGSFTLISGILAQDPIRYGSSASMVNGALESFVLAAAVELAPRRINAVSPTVLTESMGAYGDFFRGYVPVDAADVALAYARSIEGAQTGQIYAVG